MSPEVDPGNDFLSQVAPLVVGDRLLLEPGFVRQVLLADVDTIARDPAFHPHDLEGPRPGRTAAAPSHGREQTRPEPLVEGRRCDDLHPVAGESSVSNEQERSAIELEPGDTQVRGRR